MREGKMIDLHTVRSQFAELSTQMIQTQEINHNTRKLQYLGLILFRLARSLTDTLALAHVVDETETLPRVVVRLLQDLLPIR